jgi:hypothetical protein
LTIAGGYDPNISENVAYESELKIFAQDKWITDEGDVLRNVSDDRKRELIAESAVLL